MNSRRKIQQATQIRDRRLDIEELRLIADLRIMHAKVDELYHLISSLQSRHNERAIHTYADAPVLAENIRRVDEIYLWFIKLKEQRERRAAQ